MDAPGVVRSGRSRIVAWALWDTGAAAVSAIVVTFVFSVYLTSSVGRELPGAVSPASWLGRTLAISGLTVAAVAPLVGVWVAAPHRRRVTLAVLTGTAVVLIASMSTIRDAPAYLAPGLVLLALTAACGDLASVPYNAMLRQVSTPANCGRISGFGWAAGYAGSVVLLLVVYLGFVAGSGPTRGLLGLPVEGGQNVRAAMWLTAAWLATFALPLLLIAHRLAGTGEPAPPRVGLLSGYRQLWRDITAEWHRDRNLVYYLVASAVFRDGLAGVFAFGAVLGVNVYGISTGDVLIFGVAASVVAALGAIAGGLLDDRIGSKTVIVGSLVAMVAAGITLMTLSGPVAFWACGLLLCLFIGPTQSSARTLLLRMAQEGREGFEGVAFGLYTMTGRAVSFLAPWLFSLFVDIFHSDRAGMGGLCTVLVLGLLAMLGVRVPRRAA
ncbi:MFS transporter [Mycolicibacter kumamotonensis]|uniref:Membrane protein n=1 Tax=Mycolicibacter kumamotonensis TaxID=354243 RepID=A0A1B8S9E8_9MYCO|nr:MFS transporter [Mycolicibacter kumamotonensis]OBY29379.1 membrane protein [Mycolicibacter kumamotonensis]